MRAIVQQAFGGPEVLTLGEAERPVPLPTEILVRVKAIGVNPVEAIIRSGAFPLHGEPPFILGWDVSGVVEHVVPGTSRFQEGDEVFGMPLFPRAAGAYAEFVAAPSRHFARKPAALSHAQAAAIPLAGLTAWQSLVEVAQVGPGQRVLIHAGGGGVGHLAIQIAKARGAHVITTASRAKHEFLRGLGADEVIDYRAVDFEDAVKDVDTVLELIGGDYADRSLRTLRPGGLLVTAIARSDAALAARTREAGFRFAGVSVEPDYVGLEAMAALAEQGLLRPYVGRALPLEEASTAHELIESGHVMGKVVLEP
ncbi:NADP-dependent oxidoreductase [Streptomyces sp. NPDC001828]|uniref:NADP-dependent oxidoreductase n=1 Tax=Streptomyces sp. NPDC001828 TaxID=3364615 RepID=UPI00368E0269